MTEELSKCRCAVCAGQEMLKEQADLLVEPGRPLVSDKLVLKAVVLRHERQEALHLRRHVVLDEPELHAVPATHGDVEAALSTTFLFRTYRRWSR